MKKLIIVLALLAFTFFTANATPHFPETEEISSIQDSKEAVNVFVHISALKAGKKGIKTAKITKITMAKGQKPGKGVLRAKLKRAGNRLQFEIQVGTSKFDRLVMPKGFVINDRISKLLGSSQNVVMSGGSTMLKQTEKGMLWFEIQ